ncbi:MAG: hypothetical protein V4581_16750 [Bacteroidota bacterium]
MKKDGENQTAYSRRYHLQRELKTVLDVHSNKRTIYVPLHKFKAGIKHTASKVYTADDLDLDKTNTLRANTLITDYGYVIQTVLVAAEGFERVLVARSLGLRGRSITFKKERMFGVCTGTALLQVGKGKNTPTNRVDKFSTPGKYAGSIILDGIKYFALLMPPEVTPGNDLPHYMLYEQDGHGQLVRRLYHTNGQFDYSRFYLPEFKLAKPVKPVKAEPKNKQGELF